MNSPTTSASTATYDRAESLDSENAVLNLKQLQNFPNHTSSIGSGFDLRNGTAAAATAAISFNHYFDPKPFRQ